MTLLGKIYLVVLVPIVALNVLHVLSLQRVINRYQQSLKVQQEERVRHAEYSLASLGQRLDKAAISLSRPREVRNAVETADNEVLYDWSVSFINPVDTVAYLDKQGIVLSRAPDEFRFGDSMAGEDFFTQALSRGHFLGVTEFDGALNLVAVRPVLKYDDIPLGAVCVAVRLTPDRLFSLVRDEGMTLVFTPDKGEKVFSSEIGLEKGMREHCRHALQVPHAEMELRGTFEAIFWEEGSYNELVQMKHSLELHGVVAGVVTLLGLLLVLRRQLKPYRLMVQNILDYSSNQIELEELRSRLEVLSQKSGRQVARIAGALVEMTGTLIGTFQRIEQYNEQLRVLASIDGLTGLHNRRFLDTALETEARRATRYGSPLSLVLLDLDHFKNINDLHGHYAGDKVLCRLATLLRSHCRDTDIVGRWGGEEFLVICPGVDYEKVQTFAERLRDLIERDMGPDGLRCTASFGVAGHFAGESVQDFVIRADKALYQAKAGGRNQVGLG